MALDFGDWDGFNADQLPYILEQAGWQPLQGKDSVYRHKHDNGSKTSHRYWFCPDASQSRRGNERVVEYMGEVYTAKDIYRLKAELDDESL